MQVAFSVVFVGLNNSGKTTLLKSLKSSTEQVFPTAGMEIHYTPIQKVQKPILCYDCSGEGVSRKNWRTFYPYVDAIAFVIDASDTGRFKYAKEELTQLFKDHVVIDRKLPICIMLNKCDKKILAKEVFFQALQLQTMQNGPNKFYFKETSGYTKQGLDECFLWMQQAL